MKILLFILISVILFSCANETPKNEKASAGDSSVTKKTDSKESIRLMIDTLPLQTIPYNAAVDWKMTDGPAVPANLAQELNLYSAYWAKIDDTTGRTFHPVYKLPLSDTVFTSVVFAFNCSQNETYLFLFTFDKQYKVIDHVTISYDEIAEGALWKTSVINKYSITRNEYNYFQDTINPIETVNYEISAKGKFITME